MKTKGINGNKLIWPTILSVGWQVAWGCLQQTPRQPFNIYESLPGYKNKSRAKVFKSKQNKEGGKKNTILINSVIQIG